MSVKLIIDGYVDEFADKIDKRFRPTYHISTPIGWINDPNGCCYAFGKAHCFCQFYPFATHWGPISWGHFATEDFVKWQWEPVALCPDQPYEEGIGIMSGTILVEGGKMIAFYAAGSRPGGIEKQQIAFAVSEDGITFKKSDRNPVIKTEDIPDGYSKIHFRDPKIFKSDGIYYVLITASKNEQGQLLLFKSENLTDWTFAGSVIRQKFNMRGAFECPDYFNLGGKDVILCSPQFLKSEDGAKHQNVHSSVYMLGKMDLQDGRFDLQSFDDIDSGMDFYAPQTLETPDGRRIMIAWMNNWDKDYPSSADGWVGSMTFPRELFVKDGQIFQLPVRELERYRCDKKEIAVQVDGEISLPEAEGNIADIEITADLKKSAKFGLKLFVGGEYETEFYYDAVQEKCVLDRRRGGLPIQSREETEANVRYISYKAGDTLKLRILLDVSSIEIFIDDGKRTMTSTVFVPVTGRGFKIYSEGEANVKIVKYALNVQ